MGSLRSSDIEAASRRTLIVRSAAIRIASMSRLGSTFKLSPLRGSDIEAASRRALIVGPAAIRIVPIAPAGSDSVEFSIGRDPKPRLAAVVPRSLSGLLAEFRGFVPALLGPLGGFPAEFRRLPLAKMNPLGGRNAEFGIRTAALHARTRSDGLVNLVLMLKSGFPFKDVSAG